MVLSMDRSRLYTTDPYAEKVEVFDVASRKAVDKFTLTEGNKRVRISGLNVDPKHRFAVLLIKSFWRIQHVDAGFDAQGILKAEYQLPSSRYPVDFRRFPDFPHRGDGERRWD